MAHKNDALSNEILNVCRELSPNYQQAVLWFIEHFDYVETLVKGEYVSNEELNEGIKYAKEHNEYILHVLLLFKLKLNESET